MPTVEITLKSSVVTKNLRKDREPTVFKRSVRKLTEDKKHPGKIIRVYVKIDNDVKVFGVFTINTGGSISFFPDFYNLDNFDHLTLSQDFIKHNGHLTFVTNEGKHKKYLHLEINKLPTGDFHLMTFAMKDGNLLMDCLPEIHYPEIEYEKDNENEFLALLKDAFHNDPIMLEFPEEKGFYYIQLQIIPKGKNPNEVSIALGFEKIFKLQEPLDKIINATKIEIPTPAHYDYSVCIICFKILQELKTEFAFGMNQDSSKRMPPDIKYI
ncbi:MAG: hypothetical protein ABI388_06565 [Bacteroidia bacterium]